MSYAAHPSYAGHATEFTPEMLAKVEEYKTHYPPGKQKSAIIPLMHLAQKEYGWISVETMDYIAGLLNITPIEVYEVATFYTMFHLHPVGKFVLEVCRTGPCMIRGAENICDYLEKKLGVKEGEVTADGLFSWRTVECLGACGYAPMMQVGDHFHEHLTPAKVDELLAAWKNHQS